MNEYRSRPLNFPWPPLIYAVAALLALAAHLYLPTPLSPLNGIIFRAVGGFMIALGLFFDLWALKTLHQSGTTVMPNRCATHLVTTGPFQYTRNPVYLGYTLSLSGLGFLLGIVWLPVAAIAAATLTYFLAIRREELHLLSRFGCDFERYRRRARCWI
ncbi:isoprenylcysteine carboxylmethyltransferase family protein [Rhizobium sp. L1K21]|uniref:methyltransferase family protein n=1 Tax=Rhizobium sp. L1K21 TaxID=2954933 RepID=UPI0020922AC5|nr:isoprenylcysteine carboxylmethyltransferase family protein [Rhizobium sp. L1K21]MCO6186125.1 isoprenylcysteine carboxylmethyltransferase family protein [Rhizobium sp. L1K21]